MIMLGVFQLIFDNDLFAGSFLAGVNICTEIPHRRLDFFKNNIDADSLTQ